MGRRREGSQNILELSDVDGALGTDARVDLGQQGRGVELPVESAIERRRKEARDVLNDAAANRDERPPTTHSLRSESGDVFGEALQRFVFLARLNEEDSSGLQNVFQFLRKQDRDSAVDDKPRRRGQRSLHIGKRLIVETDPVSADVGLDHDIFGHDPLRLTHSHYRDKATLPSHSP